MKLWFAIGSSIAVLALSGGAMADPTPVRLAANAGETTVSGQTAGNSQAADTIVQIAAVAHDITSFASNAIVAPAVASAAAETRPPVPPETAAPTSEQPVAAPPRAAAARPTKDKAAARAERHPDGATHRDRLAAAGPAVRIVGKSETGTAAWYGGRYVGRRTTSGARLDTVHATAAHRSLPLNSLARVTNLRNGRSVVVRVTDRGPVDEALLIDMSPYAADLLQMKQAGVVPVRVEQVVEVPPDAK